MNIIKTEPTSDADDVLSRRNPKFLTLNLNLNMHDYFQDSDADATLTGRATADSPEKEHLYLDRESEESVLVRTAMKRGNQEREVSEPERWVRYSEVVESREEEVTSCSAAPLMEMNVHRSLALKLDYQEILDAWSDKGSLYIVAHQDGDQCPQTVPDYNNFNVVNESVRNLWSVPDKGCIISSMKMDEDGGKAGQREASVLRYREKRQNRLFSKRIRYEVRKLNAEKRPRMKGRFVKRN